MKTAVVNYEHRFYNDTDNSIFRVLVYWDNMMIWDTPYYHEYPAEAILEHLKELIKTNKIKKVFLHIDQYHTDTYYNELIDNLKKEGVEVEVSKWGRS